MQIAIVPSPVVWVCYDLVLFRFNSGHVPLVHPALSTLLGSLGVDVVRGLIGQDRTSVTNVGTTVICSVKVLRADSVMLYTKDIKKRQIPKLAQS